MGGQQTIEALEALRAAVDALLATQLDALPGTQVTALLTELETQRRRLEAVDQQLLAEVVDRGIAGEYGRTGPADLLITTLRVAPAEARARLDRARDLGPRHTLTGDPLDPILPLAAAAVRAGSISPGHVRVITQTLDALPPCLAAEAGPVAEKLLVQAGRCEHPGQLAHTARLLLARLDPDGLEPKEREVERHRGFSLHPLPDGSALARGRCTAELTALWQALFDTLAAPLPAADGMPDERSAAQRRHDALIEAAQRLLRSGTLPHAGGAPLTILARTTMTELATRTGIAVTGHGAIVSIGTLLQMAADAHLIPIVCSDTGGILGYGRTRRLASHGQRLALAARDGGCCFPGCARPPAWTEVHHLVDWVHGGSTDIDQLCLLCRFHHREFAKRDWQPVMRDGIPHWLPPPWLDPERKPIRNTAHHLDDFTFAG